MKKICYIHQYFKTPKEGGAVRSYLVAKALVERGIQVDMITSYNAPRYECKIIDGIKVHYIPIRYSNQLAFKKRYKAFLKFAFHALLLIQKMPRYDMIYATSTPLTIGLIALWSKWSKGTPYFFEVRDLWPEAPIQLSVIKSPIIKSLAKKLEKIIYKNSIKIIALSPGIQQGILNAYKNSNVTMIPNMADLDFFQGNPIISKKNSPFVIGYFGAFGMANNIQFMIDLVLSCQNTGINIKFLFAGEGAYKSEITKKLGELNNVLILPQKNRFEIRELMDEVDACLTSFQNLPVLSTNSPNKFFDSLAAGKLTIINTEGWLKDLVEHHKCGVYINPLKPKSFPNLIKPFIHDNKLLIRYQKNGIDLATEMFDKNNLTKDLCDLMLSQ